MPAVLVRKFLLLTALSSLLASGGRAASADPPPKDPEERARAIYFLDVRPGKDAERAMVAWNHWVKGAGANVPLVKGGTYAGLSPEHKAAVRDLMVEVYAVAGDGQKAFKTVALLLDKGLQHPSAAFVKDAHDAKPISHDASVLMAGARDAMIEDVILEVAQKHNPPWMIGRSDSGNQSSGMKSDLDQTFFVFEKNPKTGEFDVRVPQKDGEFLRAFASEWKQRNPKLSLDMLDVASIEGRNRFPDPRVVTFADYGKEFRGTIAKLRATPGAYTTYGAVLQQMQLRALAAIKERNPRSFARYGPPVEGGEGPWGRLAEFDADFALRHMFGEGVDPKVMHGHAFGAAVANLVELQHYLHAEKFETKYHLRTWDDALRTGEIVAAGADPQAKAEAKEYGALDAEQRKAFNDTYLTRLFPDDAAAQRRHALALDVSADLRNVHKGAFQNVRRFDKLDLGGMSDAQKQAAVFEDLARELHPAKFKDGKPVKEVLDGLIGEVEHQHRVLAEEFCLRTIQDAADETLGLIHAMDGHDKGWIDPDRVRHVVQGPLVPPTSLEAFEQDWQKLKGNLAEGARQTLMYAFYDLGPVEGAKLRDRLKQNRPALADAIDSLWDKRRSNALKGLWENKGDYMRLWTGQAAAQVGVLGERVQRHVLLELGFDKVEEAKMAGAWLETQHLTWSFRKAVRNAVWDPGSIDALAQIMRAFFESGGDPEAVSAAVANEMLMAIPVVGQGISLWKGGLGGALMMGLAMKYPPLGGLLLAYSAGEATYAVYDLEWVQPKTGNLVDALFRGYAGPDQVDLGEPGRPAPTWDDAAEAQLSDLKKQIASPNPGRRFPSHKELEERERVARPLQLQVDELEERRRAAQESGGGSWFGGKVFGAGAVLKHVPVSRFVLEDVKPRIAFLPRRVVDLSLLDGPSEADLTSRLSAAKGREASANDPHQALDASLEVAEAELALKRRADAAAWAKRIGEHAGIRERFQRDSLFLHLRDTLTNTTEGALDQWLSAWYEQHEQAVTEDLIAGGLLDASARTFRERLEAWEKMRRIDPDPLDAPPAAPIDIAAFRERVKAEVARSRRLYQEHLRAEEERGAVNRRNLEEAKTRFSVEMARPGVKDLAGSPMERLADGLRWLAVPRSAPSLDATLYRVWHGEDPNATAKAEAEREYTWQVGSRLSVDDSLYFPPFTVKPAFLDAAQAGSLEQADGAPLLPAAKKEIARLLKEHERSVKDGTGLIVVVSAFAAHAADLTLAPSWTWAHLPSVNVKERAAGGATPLGRVQAGENCHYLLDQVVTFVDQPKPAGGALVWYRFDDLPLPGASGWASGYGELTFLKPILKMRHQPDGSFTGSVDHVLQVGGIIDTLKLDVSGTVDPATGRVEMKLSGINSRDSNWGKGEGNEWRIDGVLHGMRDGGAKDATDWWAQHQSGWRGGQYQEDGTDFGSITKVHTYMNNTIPKSIADTMSPEEIAKQLVPKTFTDALRMWRLTAIAGPIEASEAEKPESSPLRRSFSAGATFTFDQLGSQVRGTVKFPNGNVGVVSGWVSATDFEFDWYDGRIKGQARLKRAADGGWEGGVWHEKHESGKPPTHGITLK